MHSGLIRKTWSRGKPWLSRKPPSLLVLEGRKWQPYVSWFEACSMTLSCRAFSLTLPMARGICCDWPWRSRPAGCPGVWLHKAVHHESLYCWTVVRPWAAKVNDIKLYFRQWNLRTLFSTHASSLSAVQGCAQKLLVLILGGRYLAARTTLQQTHHPEVGHRLSASFHVQREEMDPRRCTCAVSCSRSVR